MIVRFRFSKHGAVRYIGHLDVMRYFQKLIRRADLDVAYTGGFSPHQIMTFASPLGVDQESNGEYMDVKFNSELMLTDLVNKMNAASVPGIQIVSARILPEDAGNAMASVAAAEYYIQFRPNKSPQYLLNTAQELDAVKCKRVINDLLGQEDIPYEKTGKAGKYNVNLRTGIFFMEYLEEDESFHFLLDASSGNNVKPLQIFEYLASQNDASVARNDLMVTREDMYTKIPGKDYIFEYPYPILSTKDFLSMGEVGIESNTL